MDISIAQNSTRSETSSPRSLLRRIVDTFVSPGELFAGFGERPPWFGVLAISTLILIAVFALLPTELYVEQIREGIRESGEVPRGFDPAAMAGFARVMGVIGAALSQFLGAFLVAGVLALVFRLAMSGEATFRQYVGVTAHASLISALGSGLAC